MRHTGPNRVNVRRRLLCLRAVSWERTYRGGCFARRLVALLSGMYGALMPSTRPDSETKTSSMPISRGSPRRRYWARERKWASRSVTAMPFEPFAPVREQLLNLLRLANAKRQQAAFAKFPPSVLRYRREILKPIAGSWNWQLRVCPHDHNRSCRTCASSAVSDDSSRRMISSPSAQKPPPIATLCRTEPRKNQGSQSRLLSHRPIANSCTRTGMGSVTDMPRSLMSRVSAVIAARTLRPAELNCPYHNGRGYRRGPGYETTECMCFHLKLLAKGTKRNAYAMLHGESKRLCLIRSVWCESDVRSGDAGRYVL